MPPDPVSQFLLGHYAGCNPHDDIVFIRATRCKISPIQAKEQTQENQRRALVPVDKRMVSRDSPPLHQAARLGYQTQLAA